MPCLGSKTPKCNGNDPGKEEKYLFLLLNRYIYLNNLQIYRGRTQEGHHWLLMDPKYQSLNDLAVFGGRGRYFSMDTQSWLGLCYRAATPASPLPPPHLSG